MFSSKAPQRTRCEQHTFEYQFTGFLFTAFHMKNLTVFGLALVLVSIMIFAGVDGIIRGHATGPFFIFLAACTATGLSLDVTRLVKERIRRSNARKFGR
jgi:hypothetical protein